jgi:hypothetical protein
VPCEAAARQRGKDAGWFWRRQNPQEILLIKHRKKRNNASQQPRPQREQLQKQPASPRSAGVGFIPDTGLTKAGNSKALPSPDRCAQHVHAKDFLRILAGLLRHRKAAECSGFRGQVKIAEPTAIEPSKSAGSPRKQELKTANSPDTTVAIPSEIRDLLRQVFREAWLLPDF